MRRIPFLVSVVVLLALLAAVIWYIILRSPTQKSAPVSSLTPTPAVTSQAVSSSSPPLPDETFTDNSRLFSLSLPDGWNITANEGKRGLSVSSMSAESPDFSMHTDESTDGPFIPQYYDRGARFSLNAMRGPQNPAPRSSEPITIDSVTGWFDDSNSPSTTQGQDLEANVEHGGLTYGFYFSYNPDTYPEGEQVFREILDSFTFL